MRYNIKLNFYTFRGPVLASIILTKPSDFSDYSESANIIFLINLSRSY